MFIIYSPVLPERLRYVCGFIFNHVLKAKFELTDSLEALKSSPHLPVNYSAGHLPGMAQVLPHPLLFETSVSTAPPVPFFKQDVLCFFENAGATGPNCLGFDVFAAVFYFISRQEEWQPFEKDRHGRFEANASLLFRHKAHLKPLADLWIMELKALLLRMNSSLRLPAPRFQCISTIDVDNLFAYRSKGFLRTAGAFAKDLLRRDLYNFRKRLRVLSGKEKDPFDIYGTLTDFCKDLGIPLLYFFLYRSGTQYDRSVSPASGAFRPVLALLKKKQALAGLHPSYATFLNGALLKKEAGQISADLGAPVTLSRQHYLRFDIRSTPELLLKNGIIADFSMGFASSPGFRAGTAYPFYYYDFAAEKSSGLLFVPFCAMDGAYLIYDQVSPEAAYESMLQLALEIKKSGGNFISVYHERTFFDHLYPGFGPLYKKLHQRLKDL